MNIADLSFCEHLANQYKDATLYPQAEGDMGLRSLFAQPSDDIEAGNVKRLSRFIITSFFVHFGAISGSNFFIKNI